ncbi:MAG: GreA/GreB family elongation factor [Sandaracinaceae bacterium]|nr:GreA/GreB family elongation factor [Sandaracinaceae bacterium]
MRASSHAAYRLVVLGLKRVIVVRQDSKELEITLVFPGADEVDSARISVFSHIGTALLGLSVGDSIDWPQPNGRPRRLQVVDIAYQPEAAGDPV